MIVLLVEVERRWKQLFQRLHDGDDAPPALRLRAEGLMEALVLLDPGSEARVQAAMDVAYQQVYGRTLAADFGEHWADCYPFPQIPAMQRRAPVHPSTAD